MYYKFKTSLSFNHSVDTVLDSYLKQLIAKGIDKIEATGEFIAEVTFKDGSIYRFWNANKDYAWLMDGTFKLSNGSTYSYSRARPTAKTMYFFKKALSNIKI